MPADADYRDDGSDENGGWIPVRPRGGGDPPVGEDYSSLDEEPSRLHPDHRRPLSAGVEIGSDARPIRIGASVGLARPLLFRCNLLQKSDR